MPPIALPIRLPTSYPSATARRSASPLAPSRSATASAAGTIWHPGCVSEGACESSVSSECASIPLASAALMAVVATLDPTTVLSGGPPWSRANATASFPGFNCAPVAIAASVSSKWCFVFSSTSAGSSRASAPDM